MEASFDVTVGMQFFINVGGYSSTWNGGGSGAMSMGSGNNPGFNDFSGGGATDLRISSTLASRVFVAGGGGAGITGGNGGGLVGQAGQEKITTDNGQGGTQSSGGDGSGNGCQIGQGTFGIGGSCFKGVGGGGGWWGGGAATSEGSAGGGSSYTLTSPWRGVQSNNYSFLVIPALNLTNIQGDSRCTGNGLLYITVTNPPTVPVPVPYYFAPLSFIVLKGNLVGFVGLPFVYSVQLDIFPPSSSTAASGWRNVLRIIATESISNAKSLTGQEEPADLYAGGRLPLLSFCDQATCPQYGLQASYTVATVSNTVGFNKNSIVHERSLTSFGYGFPPNRWTTVIIVIDTLSKMMTMEIRAADSTETVPPIKTTTFPTDLEGHYWTSAQVYLSDPWWTSSSALIRRVTIAGASQRTFPALTPLPAQLLAADASLKVRVAQIIGRVSLPGRFVLSMDISALAPTPTPPTTYTGMNSIFRITSDSHSQGAGSAMPSITQCAPSSSTCPPTGLRVSFILQGTGNTQMRYISTKSMGMAVGEWCTVTVTVDTLPGCYPNQPCG